MIVLSRTRRIDWPRVIVNLTGCGMTLQAIADAVQVSKTQIVTYSEPEGTTEPAFWVGSALLLLWTDRTGLRWPDAPTRKVAPSVSEVLRSTA
jgi:hypothetical protein